MSGSKADLLDLMRGFVVFFSFEMKVVLCIMRQNETTAGDLLSTAKERCVFAMNLCNHTAINNVSALLQSRGFSLLLSLGLCLRTARQRGQETEAEVELQHVAHFGPEVSGEPLEQTVLRQIVIQQLQQHEACA